jgi:type VI secretion system secreted protein VgrG
VKSRSAEALAEVNGFNEIRFDDRAKQEEIFLHAQRDLNEVVLASHATRVGGDQSNAVGGNQTSSVKGHRLHSVGAYETVTVGGDHTLKAGGSIVSEAASNHVFKSTNAHFYPSGDFQVDSTSTGFNQTASFYVKAGGASISLSSGILTLDNGAGASIALVGGLAFVNAGACVVVKGGSMVDIEAGGVKLVKAGGVMPPDGGAINAMGGRG